MGSSFEAREVAVLVGTKSRQASAWAATIDAPTRSEFGYFEEVSGPWRDAVSRSAEAGCKLVAVAGGDGTLRRAAPAVIQFGLTLGILPTGTGNALAQELGVEEDLKRGLERLTGPGDVRLVDVGQFGSQAFLTVATSGITSKIAREMRGDGKRDWGKMNYLPAVLRAAGASRPFRLKVETADGHFDGLALQLVVAATRFHGGPFATSPDASHTDGKLSVYVVEATAEHGLSVFGTFLATGLHTALPFVWSKDVSELKLTFSHPRPVVLDGDITRSAGGRVSIQPSALPVFVPER